MLAIQTIGFDFIAVSRHLTVEPKSIAEKIVQDKLKRIEDDNDENINFWVYGNLDNLKKETKSRVLADNYTVRKIIRKIFTSLGSRAFNYINSKSYQTQDENELFEYAACEEASLLLGNYTPVTNTKILIEILVK